MDRPIVTGKYAFRKPGYARGYRRYVQRLVCLILILVTNEKSLYRFTTTIPVDCGLPTGACGRFPGFLRKFFHAAGGSLSEDGKVMNVATAQVHAYRKTGG